MSGEGSQWEENNETERDPEKEDKTCLSRGGMRNVCDDGYCQFSASVVSVRVWQRQNNRKGIKDSVIYQLWI